MMTESITIIVNGESKTLAPETTLSMLLDDLGIDQQTTVALRNEEIVERAAFAQTKLEQGDTLELVAFVRGG
ncbi:MAG: sulfur carrier protein ThiS [Candidatus Hydrogenedentes bacterium]|jgi:thiamine biosynthesis protein ThiS|nr:sulfur carrier protein ThiS [Candidatus Hydrogenedentota bacterium]